MTVNATVDFSKTFQRWDGFGINYVETAQTQNYAEWPQDYGGFSILGEEDKRAILDLTFGRDGLQPTVGKMFLDPLHTGVEKPANLNPDPMVLVPQAYDHKTTTRHMRTFMREGLKRVRERGDSFELIVTLYGPPAWTTKQKVLRGRDLDPAEKHELAKYMLSFVKYLREEEGLPVRYLSPHNEGEIDRPQGWPPDGTYNDDFYRHDYNMMWPPEQVADFLAFMPSMMEEFGLGDLGLTNGECNRIVWTTKYVQAVADRSEAHRNFSLITTHGFGEEEGAFTPEALEPAREAGLDIPAWITSTTWGKDFWKDPAVEFVVRLHRHIGESKVSAIIPWAVCERASEWRGGDWNPIAPFLVDDEGSWEVSRVYYLYKHFCRAGKAGMAIAQAGSDSAGVLVSAFASNNSRHPDAIVLTNRGEQDQDIDLRISGRAKRFSHVLTTEKVTYSSQEALTTDQGTVRLSLPRKSIATLQAL